MEGFSGFDLRGGGLEGLWVLESQRCKWNERCVPALKLRQCNEESDSTWSPGEARPKSFLAITVSGPIRALIITILFLGFLIIVIVKWAPKPYSLYYTALIDTYSSP